MVLSLRISTRSCTSPCGTPWSGRSNEPTFICFWRGAAQQNGAPKQYISCVAKIICGRCTTRRSARTTRCSKPKSPWATLRCQVYRAWFSQRSRRRQTPFKMGTFTTTPLAHIDVNDGAAPTHSFVCTYIVACMLYAHTIISISPSFPCSNS